MQPNSAILFCCKLRMVISYHPASVADEIFDGTVEFDENYFGGHRNDIHDRGTAGKIAGFGIQTTGTGLHHCGR